MEAVGMTDPKPKCRVNSNKPYRAGTICNYVDEDTNECKQVDWKRCPCGGIVRYPGFEELPWKESDRVATIRKDERRKVLQGLLAAMNDPALSICDTGYLEHAYWSDYIRGLWEGAKKSTVDIKPGCFGAIGLPGKRNDPGCPCAWQKRCRQSQEDC